MSAMTAILKIYCSDPVSCVTIFFLVRKSAVYTFLAVHNQYLIILKDANLSFVAFLNNVITFFLQVNLIHYVLLISFLITKLFRS